MINQFVGDYRFLSNFWITPIELDGINYPSVEHAYQAAKTFNLVERNIIRNTKSPSEAKKIGKTLKLREDWEQVKLQIMEDLVHKKFKNKFLKSQLIATGEQELIEGNYWKDTFWGVCNGKGKNHLGKIIMKVRSER